MLRGRFLAPALRPSLPRPPRPPGSLRLSSGTHKILGHAPLMMRALPRARRRLPDAPPRDNLGKVLGDGLGLSARAAADRVLDRAGRVLHRVGDAGGRGGRAGRGGGCGG